MKEGRQCLPVKQHRFSVINRCKAIFLPISYRVFVYAKPIGDFVHAVGVMDFDVEVVGVAFAHDSYQPPLALA